MSQAFETSGVVESAHSRGVGSFSQTSPSLAPAPDPSLPPTCDSCGHRLARVLMPLPAIPDWGLGAEVYQLCGGCALVALPLQEVGR